MLGSANLSATTDTTLYTVPVGAIATVNINICNRNISPVKIRIAIGSTSMGNYIEYDQNVCANDVLERTGIVLTAGQIVSVYSDTAGVSAQVWGWVESV